MMSDVFKGLREKRNLTMEDLELVKYQLKRELDAKQNSINHSAKSLIPFSKVSRNASNSFPLLSTRRRKGKTISIVEGVVMGFKMVKNISRMLRRR